MTTSFKIKFVSYFCFAYAVLILFGVVRILEEGPGLDIVRGLIDMGIWAFFGYAMLKRRDKWTYWIVVLFLGLQVFGFIAGTTLLSLSSFSILSSIMILAFLIFLASSISLVFLLQKDVKTTFKV